MNKFQREAFKMLSAVAPKKATIPILTHVLLTETEARVTDLDSTLTVPLSVLNIEVQGTGAIDLRALKTAVEAGATVFTFGESAAVWSGGSLSTLPASDFPGKTSDDYPAAYCQGLDKALAAVLPAVSSDNARYALEGVALVPGGRVVATDGHRLHVAQGPALGLATRSIIVPKSVVKILIAHPASAVCYRDPVLTFQLPYGVVLSCRELEGTFPNFEKVIPWTTSDSCILDADAFLAGTKPALAFLKESPTKSTKFTANGSLEVEAAVAESGEMRASVPVKFGAVVPITWSMNLKYLRDAFESIGPGDVRISWTRKEHSFKFEGDNGIAVIMPLRA